MLVEYAQFLSASNKVRAAALHQAERAAIGKLAARSTRCMYSVALYMLYSSIALMAPIAVEEM